jgi:hypothetical protein
MRKCCLQLQQLQESAVDDESMIQSCFLLEKCMTAIIDMHSSDDAFAETVYACLIQNYLLNLNEYLGLCCN